MSCIYKQSRDYSRDQRQNCDALYVNDLLSAVVKSCTYNQSNFYAIFALTGSPLLKQDTSEQNSRLAW